MARRPARRLVRGPVDEVVQVGRHPRHPELTIVMLWAKGGEVGERAWIGACALGDRFVDLGGLDSDARVLIVDMRPGGSGARPARAAVLRDAPS
jgi:hypothetical protein